METWQVICIVLVYIMSTLYVLGGYEAEKDRLNLKPWYLIPGIVISPLLFGYKVLDLLFRDERAYPPRR